MKLDRRTVIAGLAGLCAPAVLSGRRAGAAQPDALADLAAKADGQSLNLIVDPPQAYRDVAQLFAARFPGVRVQTSVMHPSDAAPRLIAEQKSSVFAWDAWWGTCTNMNSIAAPAEVLADLDGYLSEDAAAPSRWRLPDLRFTSPNGRFVFVHNLGLINQGAYNTALVPDGTLTLDGLLHPDLKGMISIRVPNRPHGGSLMLAQIAKEKGIGFVEELLRTMEPVYVDNDRQNTDRVMRGDSAAGIGTSEETLFACHEAGGCAEIRQFPTADMQARGVSVPRRAPNPEAAALWVNWLLGDEGQRAYVGEWAKTNFGGAHSMRVGVEPDPRHTASMPDFSRIERYSAVSYDSGWEEVRQIIALYNTVRS
jgi:ABC-type Fe3+ transport system substrate-binding protein